METLQPESIPVVRESPSLILRSTHILLVRIVTADVQPWASRSDGMPQRTADVLLELEEVLKGDVDGHAGDRFRLDITQTGRPGTRIFALPGVWSDLPLDTGTRYVAFSVTTKRALVDVAQTPALVRVAPTSEALLDARIALKAERERLPLSRLLDGIAEPDRGRLDHFFGEYVAARLGEALAGPAGEFDAVMRFVEDPRLSGLCRTVVFEAAQTQIAGSDAPRPMLARFVRTAFHLLALPEAAAMHDQISGDMLPQLLGLAGAAPTITAEQAFSGAAAERSQAEQQLARSPNQPQAQQLLRWLRR